MHVVARAKINWTLDIVGKREDGYHLMDMLMQPVELADELTLEKTENGLTLTVSGYPRVKAGPGQPGATCRASAAGANGLPGRGKHPPAQTHSRGCRVRGRQR